MGKLCECGCGEETTLNERSNGKYRKGEYSRFIRGHHLRVIDKRPAAKLDENQVVRIKRYLAKGTSAANVALMFGIGKRAIYAIASGRSWKDVPWPEGYSKPKPPPIKPPNPSGVCFCGCGMTTPISKYTNRRFGTVKGEHTRFCFGHAGWGYQRRMKARKAS